MGTPEYIQDYVDPDEVDGKAGRVLGIYMVPVSESYSEDTVLVENVSPDVVFSQPLPPSITGSQFSTPESLPEMQLNASSGRTVSRVAMPIATTVAAYTISTWFARRSRARRGEFIDVCKKLESKIRLFASDPSDDVGLTQGSLIERDIEARRRLDALETLNTEALKIARRCPWDPRGETLRKLRACLRALSERMAKVERAVEEIQLMLEVERLFRSLDEARDSGVESSGRLMTDASAIGLLGAESARAEAPDSTTNNTPGRTRAPLCRALQRGCGRLVPQRASACNPQLPSRSGREDRPRGESSTQGFSDARLSTRVKTMLSRSTEENTRCIFREELELCEKRLSEREQAAADRLAKGLRGWDLVGVDRALAELCALELPELVESFTLKRERVRSKRSELREQLREAQVDPKSEGYASRLRHACIKAEMFHGKDLPEYESAKAALEELRAVEVEVQARRILDVNGLAPDLSCNVRVDDVEGHTLLLPPCPEVSAPALPCGGAQGNVPRADMAPYGGTARRLLVGSQEVGASVGYVGEDCSGVTDVVDVSGDGVEAPGRSKFGGRVGNRTHLGAASTALSREVSRSKQRVAVCEGGQKVIQIQMQHQALVLQARQCAQAQFLDFVTRRQEDQARSFDADRLDLEKREEKATYHQEHMAQLDARKEQEERRLHLEEARQRVRDEERLQRWRERERRNDMERLQGLWSDDSSFFWSLAAADLVAFAITVMLYLTINPWTIGEGLWAIVIADCRDGDNRGDSYPPPGPVSLGLEPLVWGMGSVRHGDYAGGEDLGGVAGSGSASSVLWWVYSTVGSAAGSAVQAGYSSVSWIFGQALTLVTPDVQCEIKASLAMASWALGLLVTLRIASVMGGSDRGPGSAILRVVVLVTMIWGKFHSLLIDAWWEVVFPATITPLSVLGCGTVLQYVERNLKPRGWWWHGWDVRPILFRVLPTLFSVAFSLFLGARVGCGLRGAGTAWWCP